ncbi:hypothetical protein OKA04_09480 [Luteolibacter flavescens]|uniref:Uncharacterized protein n=1 Tax=Luteolibacter flavescens TaxID=1859460 RepID=A0ABT3FN24_9BACT|nr:hypothetical protein [Luteolibacter flavescens]MCW1884958.1 hypothetical protein [Luteolibacter flavescens]
MNVRAILILTGAAGLLAAVAASLAPKRDAEAAATRGSAPSVSVGKEHSPGHGAGEAPVRSNRGHVYATAAPKDSSHAGHPSATGLALAMESGEGSCPPSLPTKTSDRGIVHERRGSDGRRNAPVTSQKEVNPSSAPAVRRSLGTGGTLSSRGSLGQAAATPDDSRIPMPAALATSDPDQPLAPEIEEALDKMAGEFADKMEASGLKPEDPGYASLWEETVKASDQEFRAKYGKHAWLRQHLEAHRMEMHGD